MGERTTVMCGIILMAWTVNGLMAEINEHVFGTLGQPLTLMCKINASYNTVPRWSRGDLHITDNGGSVFHGYLLVGDNSRGEYNLLIENVTMMDDAIFKCFHVESTPQRQAYYNVTVIDPDPHSSAGRSGTPMQLIVSLLLIQIVFLYF